MPGYPLIEDCKCADCLPCTGPRRGSVRVEVNEDWGTGLCATFHVSTDKKDENDDFRATTFYLSLRFCKAKITSFWGNIKGRKSFIGKINNIFLLFYLFLDKFIFHNLFYSILTKLYNFIYLSLNKYIYSDGKKGIAKNMADIKQYNSGETYSFMGACF